MRVFEGRDDVEINFFFFHSRPNHSESVRQSPSSTLLPTSRFCFFGFWFGLFCDPDRTQGQFDPMIIAVSVAGFARSCVANVLLSIVRVTESCPY